MTHTVKIDHSNLNKACSADPRSDIMFSMDKNQFSIGDWLMMKEYDGKKYTGSFAVFEISGIRTITDTSEYGTKESFFCNLRPVEGLTHLEEVM